MFKKFKRVSMFLFLTLVFSLVLVGCSSDNEPSGSNSRADSGKEKDEETYDITMAFLSFTTIDDIDLVQEEINKITKEKINATVTLLPINGGAWEQQTNLMLTGNEKLDLLVTGSNYNYSMQALKGQLVPLNDLLASHGQGVLDVIPDQTFDATKFEGEIYGVPSLRDWGMQYGFVMRKDLVDKYNIDISQINSLEDLEPVFQTIKENEPNMHSIGNTNSQILNIANVYSAGYFDPLGDNFGVLLMEGEGTVENKFDNPEYIKGVELARKWFEAGYGLKDAATSTEVHTDLVKSGRAFGYFVPTKPGFEVQESVNSGHEMVSVRLMEPVQYTSGINNFMMSIARNSENPEKAMEFLNLLYSDADVMNLLANGIEGKHYVVKDDGLITLPEGVTESSYAFGQWLIGNNFLTYPWEGNEPDVWGEMEKFNNSAIPSQAFGFTFNPDPVKSEIAASTNVLEQYKLGLETGTLDPDKSISEFNEKLKASGLDKIIAEKQKQFDEWKASQ